MFSPERNEAGQRLYSLEDLKKAKLIARLLDHGHAISRLSKNSVEELERMVELLEGDASPHAVATSQVHTKPLLKQLADFKLEKVTEELQYLRLNLGATSFIFNVVLPTLREVGFMVHKKKLSITQEHAISNIVREQLGQISFPNLGERRRETALATPEGNLHELSIIIADILCRASRVPTRYLGAAHPPLGLAQALNVLKCPYLVLGSVSSDQWNYQKQIIPFLTELDRGLNYELTVILGGGTELDFKKFENITEVKVLASFDGFKQWLEGG